MRKDFEQYLIPLCIGFAPVLLLLLSWSPEGDLSRTGLAMRASSLPVLAVEMLTIIIALRDRLITRVAMRLTLPAAAIGLFLAIALLNAAFVAPGSASAWVRTIILIIHGLYGLSIMHLCGRLFAGRDLIHAWLGGFMLFAALLALFVTQVPAGGKFDWTGDLPAVSHIRHLGYYTGAIIGLCFGLMALPRGRLYSICLVAVATVAFVMAFWSGSRGAVAAAMAALVIGFLLLPALRTARVAVGGLISCSLGAAIAYLLPAPAANMGLNRAVEATVGGQVGGVTTGRTDMWERTFRAILERPFFGYGEGQMSLVAPFSTMVQPHNAALQVLLAWGLVGALCLLVLALPFAFRIIRSARRSGGEILAPLMAMMVLVVYSAYDGTLYHVFPLSIFAGCCGLAARYAGLTPANSHASPPVQTAPLAL